MANIRLRYVKAYVDRHGKARHYFRKPGCKPVALPGLPGSDEFMAAYSAALANPPPRASGAPPHERALVLSVPRSPVISARPPSTISHPSHSNGTGVSSIGYAVSMVIARSPR